MNLMLKANSPHCDSQTATTEDLGFEPSSPNYSHPALLPGDTLMATCRIKQERCESPMSEEHTAKGLKGYATRSSAQCYMRAGGSGIVPGVQSYPMASGERSSPGASSLPATDSPTSHPNEEEFEEEFYGSRNTKTGPMDRSMGIPPTHTAVNDPSSGLLLRKNSSSPLTVTTGFYFCEIKNCTFDQTLHYYSIKSLMLHITVESPLMLHETVRSPHYTILLPHKTKVFPCQCIFMTNWTTIITKCTILVRKYH